jgi:transcription elongation factor Elf1
MTAQLRVPENWPLCWYGSDGTAIKMSCPSCGAFSMLLSRHPTTGAIASLCCDSCGLSGLPNVQTAMDAWMTAAAQSRATEEEAHARAAEEADRATAVERHRKSNPKRIAA